MNDSMISGGTDARPDEDDEISLLDLGITLARQKRLIVGLPLVVAIVALMVSLLLTPIFTATTRILPPAHGQSAASSMLSALGGLAGLAGSAAGIKSPADLYMGMLKSRSVADKLIERYDLKSYFELDFHTDVVKALGEVTRISSGKDGIIVIEVDHKDPKIAAALANAYVEELFNLTKVLAVTEASQRRLFFERQVQQAKDNLAHSELAARAAIEKGGIANLEAQGRTLIETTARLRGQLAVKEVQLGAMRAYAADRNPDLLKVQQEAAAIRTELARIEGASGGREGGGARASFENMSLLRDVKYFETVFELMAKQYELAKIDEAKDPSMVQVLDKAVEPDRKSKPKRALIVILATLAAGFVAVIWAFVREAMNKARQNPATAERLQLFRRLLSWRS